MLKYSKILIFSVGIVCIVAFLFVFGVDLQWGKFSISNRDRENADVHVDTSEVHKKQSKGQYQPGTEKQVSNWGRQSDTAKFYEPLAHDPADYYQIIVDNNLFRPLGWKPPNKAPEYTLIGTSFDPTGGSSEAFVLENRSNQFHIVSVGEKIGDAIVKEIADKKVSLYKDGELITLNNRRVGFLGGKGEVQKRSSTRNEGNNQKVRNTYRSTRSKTANMNVDKKIMERIKKENEKKFKAAVKESASAQKKYEQAKSKMGKATVEFEGKKILKTDLELKMKSK